MAMDWEAAGINVTPRLLIILPVLMLGAPNASPVFAQSRGALPLSAGQPILEADAVLLASGWRPSPQNQPLDLDHQRAGVPLSSLSSCSGTGQGFCRFDYRRNGRQLSVVTIPPADPSFQATQLGGVVKRWWVETVSSP